MKKTAKTFKNKLQKVVVAVMVAVAGVTAFATPAMIAAAPVYAAEESSNGCGPCKDANGKNILNDDDTVKYGTKVNTAILDSACDCGNGEAVKQILLDVVDILTAIIGILAAIGLGVSGIQYLTAGGNEEQTRKSKRRIFEIVIGIAVYLVIYALLKWLLPGFTGIHSL